MAVRPGGAHPNTGYQVNAITSAMLRTAEGTMCAFGDWPVEAVTTASLEQFQAVRSLRSVIERTGRGSRTIGGPSAVRHALSFLRTVFNWAIRAGFVSETPFKSRGQSVIKLKRHAQRGRRLQDDEDTRLLAACGPHLRAVVECALETGMRRGEILGLQWKDVAVREIRLPASKTKTATARTIPRCRPVCRQS